jgi:hypothetical protein
MRKRRAIAAAQPAGDIEGALAALSADELRMLVRDIMFALDEQIYGRIANSLVNCAARGGSGWMPPRFRARSSYVDRSCKIA